MSAFTMDQYTALTKAMASGLKKIRYSTAPGVYQEKEYASVAEMQSVLRDMEIDLGITATLQPRYAKVAFHRWG